MNTIYLNPGPLTSLNSLTYNLGPQLQEVRSAYVNGSSPNIVLDLKYLNEDIYINIAALASLLSVCRKLSLFIGRPIQTHFSLNPSVQSYLHHVDFFKIAKSRRILTWDDKTVGGIWPSKMNPATKILDFADVINSNIDYSAEDIIAIKADLKQKIGPNFSLRCSEIFKGFDSKLENTIVNTTLELITNSLIHAKDYAFVGIQRTKKRISISVCDSGIGFRKSLIKSYPTCEKFKGVSNIQSLVIGSLIQKQEHGLRLAISHVLNYDDYLGDFDNYGWVIISSFDSEIRWQKKNWDHAISYYKSNNIEDTLPDIKYILGEESKRKMSQEEVEENGYWKSYNNQLVGVRITFEIPLQQ